MNGGGGDEPTTNAARVVRYVVRAVSSGCIKTSVTTPAIGFCAAPVPKPMPPNSNAAAAPLAETWSPVTFTDACPEALTMPIEAASMAKYGAPSPSLFGMPTNETFLFLMSSERYPPPPAIVTAFS